MVFARPPSRAPCSDSGTCVSEQVGGDLVASAGSGAVSRERCTRGRAVLVRLMGLSFVPHHARIILRSVARRFAFQKSAGRGLSLIALL